MLTQEEENFLKTIPTSKKVIVKPFDKRILKISKGIISKIKRFYPEVRIVHMGASGLGISGQNDIDIYTLSDPKDFPKYLPTLIKIFGNPIHKHDTFIEWKFKKDDFDIELYLTDPNSVSMQRQTKVFNILKSNNDLLEEYKNLKESMTGKSFRQYQRKKYEFYNKILNSKTSRAIQP